jgi:hypothetical protein
MGQRLETVLDLGPGRGELAIIDDILDDIVQALESERFSWRLARERILRAQPRGTITGTLVAARRAPTRGSAVRCYRNSDTR